MLSDLIHPNSLLALIVDMTALYIEYLNSKKNFQKDRQDFTGKDFSEAYDKAEEWGKNNLENFHPDMIRIA